jgi:protein gp37
MTTSNIPWLRGVDGQKGKVWNSTTGCAKCSPGCLHCYAETMAWRLLHMGMPGYDEKIIRDGKWTGGINLLEDRLLLPLSWKKPCNIFVDSMSDLFHPWVPVEYIIDKVMAIIQLCPQHNFIVLTKRAERAYRYLSYMINHPKLYRSKFTKIYNDLGIYPGIIPVIKLDNFIIGCSVSTQQEANGKIPFLKNTPAGKTIISIEPMLEPIDLEREYGQGVGDLLIDGIDGIIAGCESGPKRRHVNNDVFRSLRDQCQNAHIPFFLKQMEIDGKVVHMPLLDGKIWDQKPF